MSVIPLEKSPYSFPFNTMIAIGGWVYNWKNSKINYAYVFFKVVMFLLSWSVCYLMWVKFFVLFGNVRKLSWNICLNSLLMWALLKNFFMIYRSQVVDRLRTDLHRKATVRIRLDDLRVNRRSEKQMKKVEMVFLLTGVIFVPLWLISWYFFEPGERDLPVQIWVPFPVDMEDDFHFNMLFLTVAAGGILALIFVATMELGMFSILIQISREYEILIKDFGKINAFISPKRGARLETSPQETNPCLREIKIKMLLKEFTIRQQELIQYTKDFEISYSLSLLLQFFSASVVIVVCAALAILEYDNLSMNLTYEVGYLFIIFMDMFMLSWYASRIRSQCLNVGDAAYSVFWYKMNVKIQKDISMIIMRSQRPPKITFGKILELDLTAFMTMVRTIYSWLTLLEQLAFKTD